MDKMSSDFYSTHGSDAAAAASSRWLTEDVNKLIDLVKCDEAIYNPRHKYYFCRPYVENFWREVDIKLEKNPGASLAKWTNLRISFRREYTNFIEEKVPPCWSYFDRMYFLRYFLRKKVQPMQDDQFQEILKARIAHEAAKSMTTPSNFERTPSSQTSQPMENLLIYFEDQNNSETDEEVQQVPTVHIKTELEDNMDDYMSEQDQRHVVDDDDDDEEEPQQQPDDVARQQVSIDNFNERVAVAELNYSVLNGQRPLQRHIEHHSRIRHQPYVRSQPSHTYDALAKANALITSRIGAATTNYNARETIGPGVQDIVAGNTNTQCHISSSENATSNTHHSLSTASHPRLSISTISSVPTEVAAATTTCVRPMSTATSTTASQPAPSALKDLCSCKTDPDAMFLMSLLPDMQKLNGRERGTVKIAFQNILQKSLYP